MPHNPDQASTPEHNPPSSGFWTELKTLMLARYLKTFTTASQRAFKTLYLDLFAGVPVHQRRDDPTRQFPGSAIRAMQTRPRFSCLRFLEKDSKRVESLEHQLDADFPGDDRYKIIAGDCNQKIKDVLRDLRKLWMHKSPSFCFVDPYGAHVKWSTLVQLAQFRQHPRGWKMELLILFPDTAIPRLEGHDHKLDTNLSESVTDMYGSGAWRAIADRRRDDLIEPVEARLLYVELYRHKIQHVLGYGKTYSLAVGDEEGKPLYHMIYATDHIVGETAMKHVYEQAVDDFLAERGAIREARNRSQRSNDGTPDLFEEMSEQGPAWHMPYERFYENDPQIPDWLLPHLDWMPPT